LKKVLGIVALSISGMLVVMGMKNSSSGRITDIKPTHQKPITNGEKVYKKVCLSCHQADGSGVPNMTPPLIQTSFVLGDKEKLIHIVLDGLKNVDIDDQTYNNPMPALGSVLKDKEIADVLTYVRNSFGNKASAVTVAEVKAVRGNMK